jgi:hypothetical protein
MLNHPDAMDEKARIPGPGFSEDYPFRKVDVL